MNAVAKVSLLLVIVLVSLSAYLRLAHSGIGCADWPACYGQIGVPSALSQPVSSENAYQRMVAEANEPMAWATPLHRLVASVLGLLILFLTFPRHYFCSLQAADSKHRSSPPRGICPVLSRIPSSNKFTMSAPLSLTVTRVT